MYFRDRETNPKAAADYTRRQKAAATDRLKTVKAKRKAKKA